METKRQIIRLSKSCIGRSEIDAVTKVLENEFLGMGDQVKEFEDQLSELFGRPVVCVVNGTAALHLALQAIGLNIGDEVLVQSLTYVASVQAITSTNAKPVFCDINSETLTIDLEDAEKRITSKTKAIMPVHYAGGVGNLEEIYSFAKKHNLRVIEDSAHAFGTIYSNKLVGSFGDISCFSFDGIKNITSGEGGCIVTDDIEVIRKIKDSRLLGVEKDTENRFAGKRSWEFDVKKQGWRYHMSNIMAAIGIEQLKRIEEFSRKRKNYSKLYAELLSVNKYISFPKINYDSALMHIFPVIIDKTFDRDEIRKLLQDKGIQTGIHYYPNHLLSYFFEESNSFLKNTEEIYSKLITLPLHPDLSIDDIKFITDTILELLMD